MEWCVSITPLGKPVVPEVYCMFTTSWGSSVAWRAANSSSETMAERARISGTEYMPRCFSCPRNMTRLRWGKVSLCMLPRSCLRSSGARS